MLWHTIAGKATLEPFDLCPRCLLCSTGRHQLGSDRVLVFGRRYTRRDTVGTRRTERAFSCLMVSYIRSLLTRIGVLASRPGVFFVIAVYALLWILLSPDTFGWHAAATLATWMMTVFIQRAEHRDTQAIHAKLDHLLEKLEPADGNLAGLDRMQPEDIEKFRQAHSPV
jgi:low affinity Fe/Cu permease